MIMNNGQNSRSYSPVVANAGDPRSSSVDSRARLKELIKDQLAHEIEASLVLADLACVYWKMGLEGHKCKMYHKAICEFKENFDWRKYYYDVFEELPEVHIKYESKDHPKSLDDIHNKLYTMHAKNKEHLHEILETSHEAHVYTDMDILLKMYQKAEEYEAMLESKMRRSQAFGYDVAYILSKDAELKEKYKHHKGHED